MKKEPLSVGKADISPARGEIGAIPFESHGNPKSNLVLALISPLEGEMSRSDREGFPTVELNL